MKSEKVRVEKNKIIVEKYIFGIKVGEKHIHKVKEE